MFTPALRLPMWTMEHIRALPHPLTVGVAVSLALSGCVSAPPLPEAKGEFRPLNTGRWTPQPDDLKGAKSPLASLSPSAR